MDEQSRIVLAIASRVLSYPIDDDGQEQTDMMDAIREDLESERLRQKLSLAIKPLYQIPLPLIKELYVETFDLKEKAGLYLTAHELGDSRKRGMELITLQTMIQNEGFLYRVDELADYIPMLYEFLAVTEESEVTEQLSTRLSLATARIHKFLTADNLYLPIFSVLMEEVFEEPSVENLEKLEQAREKPDLDPMPYPLMYK
jgi:nitrate reductase delta subunit